MKVCKKLTCDDARELMFTYIDGECGDEETTRLDRHLESCGECRRELGERRRLLELIKEAADRPAPPELYPRVMERVGREPQNKPVFFSRFYIPFGTIAAACAVIVLVILNRSAIGGLSRADAADAAQPSMVAGALTKQAGGTENGNARGGENVTESISAPYFSDPLTTEYADDLIYNHNTEMMTGAKTATSVAADNSAPLLMSSPSTGMRLIRLFSGDGSAVLVCDDASSLGVTVGSETEVLLDGSSYPMIEYSGSDAAALIAGYRKTLDSAGESYDLYLPPDGDYSLCRVIFTGE